jgi:RNA binding exosome subunit
MEADRELNNMQQFVNEYEEIQEIFKNLINKLKEEDFKGVIEDAKKDLEERQKRTYDRYKEILAYEEEDKEDNDYNNNDGIWEGVMRERSKGFYGI